MIFCKILLLNLLINLIYMDQAIFCGGCFWCTEAIFKRLNGVISVTPGYTGGNIKNPAYREVCEGTTGHAEGVSVFYDSSEISYEDLLEVFFSTHNPTTLNSQGNDVGEQYRSAIFYINESQKISAKKYINFLEKSKVFNQSVVTVLKPFDIFYDAEDLHKDYYDQNKSQPYCQFTISPKIKLLNKKFSNKIDDKFRS